jgi:flavodoxin
MKKFIVIYFSHQGEEFNHGHFEVLKEGFTAHLAKEITNLTNSKSYEIKMVHPYPVSYQRCIDLGQDDLQKNKQLELEETTLDLTAFDGIILGYPIWFGAYPQPVRVFLGQHKDEIKTLYPFITSGGGSPAHSLDDLNRDVPNATIFSPLSLKGSSVYEDDKLVKDWLIKNALID